MAHAIVATGANLALHHVPTSPKCILCGFHWSDTTHALFFCQVIKGAWKNTGWWSYIKKLRGHYSKDLLVGIDSILPYNEFDKFCTMMWGAWKDCCMVSHNLPPSNSMHKAKSFGPGQIPSWLPITRPSSEIMPQVTL